MRLFFLFGSFFFSVLHLAGSSLTSLSPWFEATKAGDLATVERWVDTHQGDLSALINARNQEGKTGLNLAVEHGERKMIWYLCSHQPNFFIGNNEGRILTQSRGYSQVKLYPDLCRAWRRLGEELNYAFFLAFVLNYGLREIVASCVDSPPWQGIYARGSLSRGENASNPYGNAWFPPESQAAMHTLSSCFSGLGIQPEIYALIGYGIDPPRQNRLLKTPLHRCAMSPSYDSERLILARLLVHHRARCMPDNKENPPLTMPMKGRTGP